MKLLNFEENNLPAEELPFFLELIEILGIESIEYQNLYETAEITIDNVFTLLKLHEQHSEIYNNRFCTEIEFIASHFSELCKDHERDLEELSIDTLLMILMSDHLELESEDQLLRFVNNLYEHDVKYSILYETINFGNVTSEVIKEFTAIFDINTMTMPTWRRLAMRLEEETKSDGQCEMKRFKREALKETDIELSDDDESEEMIDQPRQVSNSRMFLRYFQILSLPLH